MPGVDGCQVGPHDLSCNYGIPEQWENPKFLEPINRIIDVSKKYHMCCTYSVFNTLPHLAASGRIWPHLLAMPTSTQCERACVFSWSTPAGVEIVPFRCRTNIDQCTLCSCVMHG